MKFSSSGGREDSRRQAVLSALTAVLTVNLPFWLLGYWFYLTRPVFNVDVILAVLLMTLSMPLGLLALVGGWLADGAVNQSFAYHFSNPVEFVRSTRFISNIDVAAWLNSAALPISLLFIACGLATVWIVRRLRPHRITLAAVAVLLLLLDALNGSSMLSRRDSQLIPFNVAGSPAQTLSTIWRPARAAASLRVLPPHESAAQFTGAYRWAEAHSSGSMLFVVVESFGQHRDERVRQWLLSRLADASLRERFDVQSTTLPFAGTTTWGELRSLCGLAGVYRQFTPSDAANCLPHRLLEMGWQTIGLHGFSKRMFDRELWWPTLGLKTTLFADHPQLAALPQCGGAFRGACDAEMIELAVRMSHAPKSFVYLLTLSTHLPLERGAVPEELAALCAQVQVGEDVCQLTAGVGRVLSSIRQQLVAQGARPLVVIVGDHAPPFTNLPSREQYSHDSVPVFVLKPLAAR